MYDIYTLDKEVVGYTYNKENETYTYSSNLSHGGLTEGIIYKKLINFKSDLLNNKQFKNFNNKIDLPVYKNIFDANEYIKKIIMKLKIF